jgi:parallel beta-helix repeat protein
LWGFLNYSNEGGAKMKIKHNIILYIGIAFLLVTLGTASASTLTVNNSIDSVANFTLIQDAVNASTDGDIIMVYPGFYEENIVVSQANITIKSQSENPADTIVMAADTNDDVFSINADKININGFSIDGASEAYGIYLDGIENCVVTNNIVSDNYEGIYFNGSNNNTLSNNKLLNNSQGISLEFSNDNIIYNNLLNNKDNVVFGVDDNINLWNITKTTGTNIVGGLYLGGNYWAEINGTGFSQTANDTNGDGISDLIYTLDDNNIDYLPLTLLSNETINEIPVASIISISPNPAIAGSSVEFNGSGNDTDGFIINYEWTSIIDGYLGNTSVLTISTLSIGNHTINFRVQDNDSAWSPETTQNLTVVDDGAPYVSMEVGFTDNISINNPVNVTLNSTDLNLDKSEFVITDYNNTVVYTENVTDKLLTGEYTFTWNATGQSGEILESGNYSLNLTSTDVFGQSSSEEISVSVDNTAPVMVINSINGTNNTDQQVYANSELLVNVSESATYGNATTVDFVLSSAFSNFETDTNAVFENESWTASFDLSQVPDDGNYTLTIVAEDGAKNINSTLSEIVIIDRIAPGISSVVSMLNDTYAYVNVTSTEALQGNPELTVDDVPVSIESMNDSWNGIFQINGTGIYTINMNGSDLAGNIGNGESEAYVASVAIFNGTGTFSDPESNIILNFNAIEDSDEIIVVTESTTTFIDPSSGQMGIHFLAVQLNDTLANNLSNATISIRVDESLLPVGIGIDDVAIYSFNETANVWEELPTTVQNVDGIDYWVTQVEQFSGVYAAIASDTVAPVLQGVNMSSGPVFEGTIESMDISFSYSDMQTGVNVSSIAMTFDDMDITNSTDVMTTGSNTKYSATNLTEENHSVVLYVIDNAGNAATFSTSFAITTDGQNSGNSSSSSPSEEELME